VPVQWPVGEEEGFRGVVDLIQMKAAIFDSESLGATWQWEEVPEDLLERCQTLREQLVEACADVDDEILRLFLEGKPIGAPALYAAIRRATVHFAFVPVLCGAAFKNKGIQPLLDAIVNYLPSPLDIPRCRARTPPVRRRCSLAAPVMTSLSRRWRSRSPTIPMSVTSHSSACTRGRW
jgi:elongation factor G